MEPLSSAFWAASLCTLETARLHTVGSVWCLVLADETYYEDLKALGLRDEQNGEFGEESAKQKGYGPDFHLPRMPKSSEGGSLVIWPGLIPSEGPDCVLSGRVRTA